MNLTNYRTSIILAVSLTILLSMFWFYQDFAFIIFLSLLLQLLLEPAVDYMERRRVPRALAAALAICAFILVLIALASVISRSFIPSFQRFIAELPTIGASIQQMPIFADTDIVSHILERLRSVGGELVRTSLSFLLTAFGKVIDFVIIIFVSFYLLKDGAEIKRWLADLFPHKSRGRVLRLFDTLLTALRAYICSQLVLCAITGVVVLAYFKLMGLPYASVFALLSGVGEFIPVLGPTVASTLGVLMTAASARELIAQTALFYVALTQVNHNIVYPALVGKSLHLHPVAVILGVVLGGELLGAAGMFLAVPIIVIVKIVITDIYRDRREMQKAEEGEQ